MIAVNDGKIVKIGQSKQLGRYVELQDATGNIYTYANLGSIPSPYPVPKPRQGDRELDRQGARSPRPAPPRAGRPPPARSRRRRRRAPPRRRNEAKSAPGLAARDRRRSRPRTASTQQTASPQPATADDRHASTPTITAPLVKERLFADPHRPPPTRPAASSRSRTPARRSRTSRTTSPTCCTWPRTSTRSSRSRPARSSSPERSSAGSARAPPTDASHLEFMIRPAGKNAPYIDPKPILDGWKLLEATAVYRAAGVDPFFGPGAKNPTDRPDPAHVQGAARRPACSQDPNVKIYPCGRRDIQAGADRPPHPRRTSSSCPPPGLKPDVSGLKCGNTPTGANGVDPAGATGASMDISTINNIPITGPPGRRLDHRHHDPPPAHPPGRDAARRDRLDDELQGPAHHGRHDRPRATASRSPTRSCSATTRSSRPGRRQHPPARPVDQADQPHQPDPRADRPDLAEQVRDQDAAGNSLRAIACLFRFSQLELPWALGPPDGRYLIRRAGDGDPDARPATCSCSRPWARASAVVAGRSATQRKAQPEPEPTPVDDHAGDDRRRRRPASTDPERAAAWLTRAGEADLADGPGRPQPRPARLPAGDAPIPASTASAARMRWSRASATAPASRWPTGCGPTPAS